MRRVYSGIDIMKLCAACGVVAIHSGAVILNVLGRLGVPFFAIISGFFFFKKYLSLQSEGKKVAYLKSYLKRIFYLYILWQILYIPLFLQRVKSYSLEYQNTPMKGTLLFIWRFIFPGHGYTSSGVFIQGTNGWGLSWYLIALLMGLPILCFMIKYIHSYLLLGVTFVALEVCYVLSSGYQVITHFNFWGILAFPRLFIYLFIGLLLSQHVKLIEAMNLSKVTAATLICLFTFGIENIFVYKLGAGVPSEELFSTVPTTMFIAILSMKYNPKLTNTLLIRNFSTFLYTSQDIFLALTPLFLTIQSIFHGVIQMLIVIMMALICFVIYEFTRRKTGCQWLSYMV